MNVIAILAGGTGQRMNVGTLPKQFLCIDGVPIIIRTIQKCLEVKQFDIMYIAIHPNYKGLLEELLTQYNIASLKIKIIHGGKERLNTIENVINDIYQNYMVSDNDIIVIHDAVRPFVSKDLLLRCIESTKKYGATVPAVSAIDTMYVAQKEIITSMPDRNTLYSGQTPDNFKIPLLKCALDSLTNEERTLITGTAQICMMKGIEVHVIEGDYKNIKITTPTDLMIAEKFYEEEEERF